MPLPDVQVTDQQKVYFTFRRRDNGLGVQLDRLTGPDRTRASHPFVKAIGGDQDPELHERVELPIAPGYQHILKVIGSNNLSGRGGPTQWHVGWTLDVDGQIPAPELN